MLSKLEAGIKAPSEPLVARVSAALGYPPSFFYQTDPVFGAGLSEFYHRKRQSVGVKTLARTHAQINVTRMHVARLLRSVDLVESKIKPLDMDDFDGRPNEVARAVRMTWNMPDGPIPNVIQMIEDAGGIVIRFPFGTPQIDAISRWVPGLPPMFFVNAGLTTDRERLTLCHELGHIIMHDVPSPNMEREADQFAAELLMPERDVSPHLDVVTVERLAQLKPYWRVSMRALLMRASSLRKMNAQYEKFMWIHLSPYRRREPPELDLSPETPTLLQEIIGIHRDEFGFGPQEFASVLSACAEEITDLYGIAQTQSEMRSTLRVVKSEKLA
jgi:Zn-dependent peptidase ImmA (M78 family)